MDPQSIRQWRVRGNELLTAARKGNASYVARLTSDDPKLLEYCDNKKRSALHRAAMKGHCDVVQILLDAGSDVNAVDQDGWTALHIACRGGFTDVANALMLRGADTEALTADNMTPLYCAALAGMIDCARLLLDAGVSPGVPDKQDSTPLHLSDNAAMTNLLLEHGADINLKNADGYTPLHISAINGWIANAQVLIDHGADVNAADNTETPLACAASNSDPVMCKLLLAHGANPSYGEQAYGRTPLHLATRALPNSDDTTCLKVLLDAGVDVNAADDKGVTALHFAALRATSSALDLLLEHGANVNILDCDGFGPLDWALGVTPPRGATAAPRRRPQITPCSQRLMACGAQVSAAAAASHPEVRALILRARSENQQAQEGADVYPPYPHSVPLDLAELPDGAETPLPLLHTPTAASAAAAAAPVVPALRISTRPVAAAASGAKNITAIIAGVGVAVVTVAAAAFVFWRSRVRSAADV
eukprot:TRINITY_DN4153_c0_g1_i1.p1 TRINITY_DN4153_c0_g1~~TRINITY_DN4153_c0_g1_i1.p1  ORF type:complete len:486 (+),score=111.22 TRINITY_DN4153_c0_g1_i1:30-1460(+)